MVFSSIPAYLDPANWQQQHQTGSSGANPPAPAPPPPPPPPPHGGPTRPNSMTERARLANIPMPESSLKCPRCESTNTKFCYFNNYSLSQPRHFCKTCRRYWTRGGALRNVPVGGGCRRNRRSKGSRSKSPVDQTPQTGPDSSSATIPNSSTADITGLSHQIPPSRFLAPLQNLSDYAAAEIGLNYGLQQFPLFAGADPSMGLYPFGGSMETSSGGGLNQTASVKVEDNLEMRQFMGIQGTDHYWSGATSAWTDLSGFSSCSTSHHPL